MGFFDFLKADTKKVIEYPSCTIESDFSEFHKVTHYIYEKSGIVDLEKRALTGSKLQKYAQEKKIYTTQSFLEEMKVNKTFYQEIINIATVNETFFLRELTELQWLVEYIQQQNRPLKILSIPSSSGEEIYSIALLLDQKNVDRSKISFYGYDINSYAIKCAKKGEYNEHSLHKLDQNLKEKYFTKLADKEYKISTYLQNNTSFEQKNIFDITQKEEFDVILSRNMFIYFDTKNRVKALDTIVTLLKKNGIYIKGHADNIQPHLKLRTLAFGIYQKNQY